MERKTEAVRPNPTISKNAQTELQDVLWKHGGCEYIFTGMDLWAHSETLWWFPTWINLENPTQMGWNRAEGTREERIKQM